MAGKSKEKEKAADTERGYSAKGADTDEVNQRAAAARAGQTVTAHKRVTPKKPK